MKVVLTSVVVAASVFAGFVLWTSQADEPLVTSSPALVSDATSALEPPEAASTRTAVETLPTPSAQRTPVAGEQRELPREPPPNLDPAARTVGGRVLDATGSALAGVDLVLSSGSSKAACTSEAGGWFEIALDVPADAIVSADPMYVTVLAGSARIRDSTLATVVVAPRIDLAGTVFDEARTPLAAASLELCLPPDFGAEWGVPLDYSLPQHWRVRSQDDGTFQLTAVPAIGASVIGVALAGFAPHAEDAPLRSTSALDIVLARPGPASGLVHGVVLDPAGARVEGARVSAGEAIALTGGRGEFTLDVQLTGTDERLVALKAGLLPAFFEPTRDRDGRLLWPAEVVLQLGGPTGTVSGRVVDAEGNPIGDAKVWIDDPTSFGRSAEARHAVESLLRGDERFWSYVRTSTDGTFVIGGLLERAYHLQAVDPRTLASAEAGPVSAADSPVELRLPTDDAHEKVSGHVVSARGRPIPGVSVRLFRLTYEVEHEGGTDNEAEEGAPVVTDMDGAFEFRNVPRKGVNVIATGDTILGAAATLEEESDPRSIEIVASLRLHVQVELDEPFERADRLKVFDADGGRVILRVFHGAGANADFEMPILDGRSRVISVEESATTLALYLGEEEVARIPLSLVPGQTNRVRY